MPITARPVEPQKPCWSVELSSVFRVFCEENNYMPGCAEILRASIDRTAAIPRCTVNQIFFVLHGRVKYVEHQFCGARGRQAWDTLLSIWDQFDSIQAGTVGNEHMLYDIIVQLVTHEQELYAALKQHAETAPA